MAIGITLFIERVILVIRN